MTVNVRQDLKPKKILCIAGAVSTRAIWIVDEKGQELCNWVRNNDSAYKEQEVPEGEEIVGIFGKLKKCDYYIESVGFITVKYS